MLFRSPWNICRHSVAQAADGRFVIDRKFPLIFFHYSGIEEVEPNLFLCSNVSYLGPFSRTVRRGLYKPYIELICRIQRELGEVPRDSPAAIRGGLPRHRRILAPFLRIASKLAGHYIASIEPQKVSRIA